MPQVVDVDRRCPLFMDTVLRKDAPGDTQGRLWLMNRQEGGWRQRGIVVKDEAEVLTMFKVRIGAWTRDEHGPCAPVERV